MHGIIFAELKNFIDQKWDKGLWQQVLNDAGLGARLYLAIADYPDEEIYAIVNAGCRRTGMEPTAFLEAFGENIVPPLLRTYAGLIKPEWKTLDFLEYTENNFHRFVTKKHGAHPPKLVATRPGKDEVVINYSSHRRMCAFASGIAKAVARHYQETVTVSHLSCMHRGDAVCLISVKLV
ncbi:MAG TPA: heme NO-binding domain-containing protein [Chloroflexia bacterium]|nr:heme NO-binding domain-containing protein [Chloroflexia bacterium]